MNILVWPFMMVVYLALFAVFTYAFGLWGFVALVIILLMVAK